MAVLMEDLVDDILTRLPVKSLLRYKCVCKQWYALINSNTFVKQHLSRSILTNTSNRALITKGHFNLYSLPLYSLDQSHPVLLAQPMSETEFELLGSSNGLLCLCSGKVIIIWNPTTRKHVKLPVLDDVEEFISGFGYHLVRGFGYDSISDDYKLVRVLQTFSNYEGASSCRVKTNIYSLRSHSWRKYEHIPDYVIYEVWHGVFTCGAIHWVARRRPEVGFKLSARRFVIALDLATEEYMVITPPEGANDEKFSTFFVRELGGCLSIVCKDDFRRDDVDVWVMNSYGITESWTKLLNISSSEVNRSVCFCVKPLVYSECGDEVLLVNSFDKLFWYNLENRTVKFVDVHGLRDSYHHLICLESLVSLGGRAENDDERQGGKKHNGRSKKKHPRKRSKTIRKPIDI